MKSIRFVRVRVCSFVAVGGQAYQVYAKGESLVLITTGAISLPTAFGASVVVSHIIYMDRPVSKRHFAAHKSVQQQKGGARYGHPIKNIRIHWELLFVIFRCR